MVGRMIQDWIQYLKDFSKALLTPPFRVKETIQQIYEIGFKSTFIILFSVSFAAAVTIIEYSYHIRLVIGTAALVPGFAALLVLRELGAVITALLLTSRVGAGIAAEVGTMQVTEQIDALRLLNIDPIRYLVVPRFVASVVSCVMLVVFANATCLFSAMVISSQELGFSWESFLHALNHFAQFKDVLLACVKGAVFGSVIPIISCFYGFHCKAGAEGVGRATTQSVVSNAVSIIVLDFILTYLFSFIY
jgi:phospholipid/cholesterol/gamma-HCH transport system permease protein